MGMGTPTAVTVMLSSSRSYLGSKHICLRVVRQSAVVHWPFCVRHSMLIFVMN